MNAKLRAAVEREQAAYAAMQTAADELEEFIGVDDDAEDADKIQEKRDEAQARFDAADAKLQAANADVIRLEHIETQRAAVPRELPADTSAQTKPLQVQVTREESTYAPRHGNSFFRDLIDAGTNPEALDRLRRNNAEFNYKLQAAGLTQTAGAGGEFVPPVWYVDQYAPLLRAGRPFVDAVGTSPLPDGTNSLNLPKITTGASAAVQTDTGSVSNTDLATTGVTAQVQTVAGRTVASYQTVDLGPVTDQMIMQDLTFAYNTALDTALISGNVANAKGILNVASVNTVTYTDATPTGAEFYLPTAQSASQIAKNAFVPTDLLLTHPSIWYNILAGLDGATRPLYLTVGPGFNIAGNSAGLTDSANGVVGNIAGIPVCVDANVPTNLGGGTNESRLVALNRQGFNIWESGMRFRVADQTSITTLQYQFVAYGYYATMSRQPKMISIVSGTGLIPVSGF